MTDEPSAADLSPDETYRSIGRYVYEFSQLVAHMRAMMTRYLNTTPRDVAEFAFAQSGPDQIATAFFGMCRTVTRLDLAEEKTATRLGVRVSEAIEMRTNVAHGDWWVGSSVLGVEAVERSARDLDARSDSLVTLINLVAEYGAVCLRQPPYSRGEHRVSDYIVMRAGEAVREGPKALVSRHVFYKPPPREQLAAASPASVAALRQPLPEAAPAAADIGPEPEFEPDAVVEPMPAPQPMPEPVAQPLEPEVAEPEPVAPSGVERQSPRRARRLSLALAAIRDGLRAQRSRTEPVPSVQALPGDGPLPKWLTHNRLRRLMLGLAALTAALVSVAAYDGHFFGPFELKTIDARFAIRGAVQPGNIVVVAADNNTIGQLGGFPFARRYDADVINRVYGGGASTIGVDLQFTNQTDPTDDNDLINAVAHARGIVLSTTFLTKSGGTDVLGQTTQALKSQLGAYVGQGFVFPDSDGVLRRMVYSVQNVPSFAVVMAARASHHPVPHSEFPGGSSLVDFAGPDSAIPQISFLNVLHGDFAPGFFHHKIVLIGVTAPVTQDIHNTAVDGTMPGVDFQANSVWSILHGNELREASSTLDLLIILLAAMVMPVAGLLLRPGPLLVGVAFGLAALYLVSAQLAFNSGTVLPVLYPLLALTLGTLEATAADLWAERRRRQQLEVYKVAYERLPSTASAGFFISYRRDQSSWPARILRDELVRRFGEDQVFKDSDSIQAGQEWPEQLESAIRNASVVLVLIGPDWADARGRDGERRLENPEDWVRLEVEAALENDGAAVVPVLVDGASMPAADVLPESLRPLTEHQAFALSVERWNADLEALIESIHSGRIRDFLSKERAGAGGS